MRITAVVSQSGNNCDHSSSNERYNNTIKVYANVLVLRI